jgi:toxin ParE1/3/4
MEVVLLLSAERDLQEAYNWVEEHRRGREQFFLQDVEVRLEHLQKYPLIGRLYRGRYRRLLIPRYPFGIFYVVESNRIVVHAVPDLRQDPERSESAFPNRGYFTLTCLVEAIFVFNSIVELCSVARAG